MIAALFGGPLAWLASPLLKAGKWLLIGLIIVLVVLGLERYVRNRGKLEAKVEGLERAQKVIHGRRKIEQAVRTMPVADRDEWLLPPSQRRKQ